MDSLYVNARQMGVNLQAAPLITIVNLSARPGSCDIFFYGGLHRIVQLAPNRALGDRKVVALHNKGAVLDNTGNTFLLVTRGIKLKKSRELSSLFR